MNCWGAVSSLKKNNPTVYIKFFICIKKKTLLSACAYIWDTLAAIDWTVVSQAISLTNSSTRHCVSQHYSWGSCYVPRSSLHPRLSPCLMDSLPQTHTCACTLARITSSSLFSSLSLPSACWNTQRWLRTHTHTHRYIPGLIHYALNVCFVEDTEQVLRHLLCGTLCSHHIVWGGEKKMCCWFVPKPIPVEYNSREHVRTKNCPVF